MSKPLNTSVGQGSWGWRRLFLFTVNAFCGAAIILAMRSEVPQTVALAVVCGGFGIMATSILAYVFGAVVDDQLIRRTFGTKG